MKSPKIKESEKVIESLLTSTVELHKGWCIKFLPFLLIGFPDRIVLLPGGVIFFAELKSTGKKPKEIQLERHERLRRLGFKVYVIDSTEKVIQTLEQYLIL